MKRFMLALFCLLVLAPLSLTAQTLDPQVRILAHSHFFDGTSRVGVATWSILPDVTKQNFGKDNPVRLLEVLGPAFRSKDGRNWLEVMGGALVEINRTSRLTSTHPMLNVRAYVNWGKTNDLYLENQTRGDRLLFSAFATTPLAIGNKVRLGVESEVVIPLNDKVTGSFNLGPRLSVKLPYSCLLATVMFVNQDGKLVWRTYIKFGK